MVTVVFFSANPTGTTPLRVDQEYRAIDDEKQRAARRDQFDLRDVPAAQVEDFRRKLEEHRPAVVHFGGHGLRLAGALGGGRDLVLAEDEHEGIEPGGAAGEIVVEGEAGGAVTISLDAFAERLRLACGRARDPLPVRCVVLNACHTGALAEAVAAHVECAIGTLDAIADEAAIAFSRGFYGVLFRGGSVKEAFDSGVTAIREKRAGNPEMLRLWCRPGVKPDEVYLAGEVAPRGVPFHVPFPRNERFVGREDDLARLHRLLQERRAVGVRPAMLTGMGGIGKTQLAVEYAFAHRSSYPGGVFWVEAAGDDFRPGIAALAVKVGLGAEDAPEGERQSRLVAAFEAHLRARPDALVVFDNVDNPADMERDRAAGFVPVNLDCRLLFTTRKRDEGGRFASAEVSVLPEEAALELLLSGDRRRGTLERGDAAEVTAARAICRMLGYLPLALVLAGAFVGLYSEEDGVSLGGYLTLLAGEGALPAGALHILDWRNPPCARA